MNSRERVKRAIEFKSPDRVPIYRVNIFKSDVMTYFTLPSKTWQPREPYFPYVYDEIIQFGLWRPRKKLPQGWRKITRDCIWNIDPKVSTRGCIKKGAIQDDWSLLNDFKPPNPRDHSRFKWCRYGWTKRLGRNRYRMGMEATFLFERFHFMRGFENFMTDMILYPEESGRLLDLIADYFIGLVETFHEYGMHGFATTDDLGTQINAFISPEMFAKFFTPRYKRVIDRCHELGMYSILHYFGGKAAFANVVDIQEVLPNGNPQEIEDYVKRMIKNLGAYNGGLIGMQYADKKSINVKYSYERMMWKAYDKWGKYPLKKELGD